MYQEYRWPIKDENKAAKKIAELKQTYGYRFPVYKIQDLDGNEYLSVVYPKGLEPNPKKSTHQLF